MEETYKELYTRVQAGIRIDKIQEPGEVVVVPEEIGGIPVVELGPYVLADTKVKELHLPSGICTIGAYAFYNCEELKRLYCYSRIRDLGTGIFAGTKGAEYLDYRLLPGEPSYFKGMLSELRQTLRVRLHGTQEARLIFPEYFEECVENTPARMLFTDTHGCGHRYRYSFHGREFLYLDYDELFSHVQVQESETLVMELALGRMRYPWELTPNHEAMYHQYIAEHWQVAAQLIVAADCSRGDPYSNLDSGMMPWFGERYITQKEQVQVLVEIAQKVGDAEAISWIMDYAHRRFEGNSGMLEGNRKRRFEL